MLKCGKILRNLADLWIRLLWRRFERSFMWIWIVSMPQLRCEIIPTLIGKPIAVGGEAKHRGVLATCNYEARKFGLHSAMSTAQAFKLCPNLILLPVNMPLYKQVSQQIHQIFRRYTDVIEPLSLDEAYLDVTDSTACSGSATWIATEIRQAIFNELGLTASAGIAPLKFLAKIASEQNKPNGQFVIKPEQIEHFIANLPLKKSPEWVK